MCLIPFLLFIYGAQGYIPKSLNIFDMMLSPITGKLPCSRSWFPWRWVDFLVASIKVVESQEF